MLPLPTDTKYLVRQGAIDRLPGDLLRELLSEGYHDYGDRRDAALRQLPKDLPVDILRKAWDKKCESYGPWRNPCKYHGHPGSVVPHCAH
ncbi:hypothetical protein HBI23_166330 [Parastagonospora nodorum]|nr:hypothetical protein HBI12_065900 [Parastagonospora nodorum]KAH5651640.1 hypothetical protein HBI23_166330 [Parastagonospora nodorum]